MKQFFKDTLFALLRVVAPGLGDRASILMYHSVDTNRVFFTVSPEAFEKQMQYLVSRKVTFLKLSELVRRLSTRESIANCICITFDDGYEDNYTNVYPILAKYRIPAAIFLTTSKMGGTMTLKSGTSFPMLSALQITEMNASGIIEFFPHSVTHVRYKGENLESCVQEARESRKFVEQLVGGSAAIYAYPSGDYDARFAEALSQGGYVAAVTVEEGLVRLGDDPLTLKRNAVDSATTMTQFKGKVSGAIGIYTWLKKIHA